MHKRWKLNLKVLLFLILIVLIIVSLIFYLVYLFSILNKPYAVGAIGNNTSSPVLSSPAPDNSSSMPDKVNSDLDLNGEKIEYTIEKSNLSNIFELLKKNAKTITGFISRIFR